MGRNRQSIASARFVGDAVALARVATPLSWLRLPAQENPAALAPGGMVDVAGRGALFVREVPGPVDELPVVLLHPWTWTSAVAFASAMPRLARGRRVIAFDLRGHGRSVGLSSPLRLSDFVDDLVGLLDALSIERAVLVGHSLGGIVSIATALRHPRRVGGLVAVGAADCYSVSRRDRAFWFGLRRTRVLARLGIGSSLPLRYFLPAIARNPDALRRWRWLEQEVRQNSLPAMWEVGRMVSQLDLRAELRADAGVSMRRVMVVLTRDRVCAPAMQRATAARLGATTIELDADHDVPIAAPAVYADTLAAALAATSNA